MIDEDVMDLHLSNVRCLPISQQADTQNNYPHSWWHFTTHGVISRISAKCQSTKGRQKDKVDV